MRSKYDTVLDIQSNVFNFKLVFNIIERTVEKTTHYIAEIICIHRFYFCTDFYTTSIHILQSRMASWTSVSKYKKMTHQLLRNIFVIMSFHFLSCETIMDVSNVSTDVHTSTYLLQNLAKRELDMIEKLKKFIFSVVRLGRGSAFCFVT